MIGIKMKVLLAIDDSEYSKAALRAVIRQFRPRGTTVHILHVFEPLELLPEFHKGDIAVINETERRLIKSFKNQVARTAELLKKAGFKTKAIVIQGDHRGDIVDYAKRWKADLIVLGSHGRRGLSRLLMGSVAEFVSRHAPCSVEIVRIPNDRVVPAKKQCTIAPGTLAAKGSYQ
jgi:nucleotide-binding universal stress UspA family protein